MTVVGLVVGVSMVTPGARASSTTVSVAVLVLPTSSRAVTVNTLTPASSATPAALQVVVPVATPLRPRLLDHDTSVTPRSSEATPPRVSVAVFTA